MVWTIFSVSIAGRPRRARRAPFPTNISCDDSSPLLMTSIKQPRTGRVVWAEPKKGLSGSNEGPGWFQLFVNALRDDSDVGSGVNFKVDKRVV